MKKIWFIWSFLQASKVILKYIWVVLLGSLCANRRHILSKLNDTVWIRHRWSIFNVYSQQADHFPSRNVSLALSVSLCCWGQMPHTASCLKNLSVVANLAQVSHCIHKGYRVILFNYFIQGIRRSVWLISCPVSQGRMYFGVLLSSMEGNNVSYRLKASDGADTVCKHMVPLPSELQLA